jgi:hypothetical protein
MSCVPGKNSVTSYAFPCTITQHESLELCFAISSPVRLPTSGFSLAGLFMIVIKWRECAGGEITERAYAELCDWDQTRRE